MRGTLKERFEDKVELIPFSTCHWWVGYQSLDGYGRIMINGTPKLAHRVAYEIYVGKIPKSDSFHGTCVLHKCDQPSCVNPSHLFLGTHQDNMEDCRVKGRIRKGSDNGMAKLTEENVREIRKLGKTLTQQEISNMYNTSPCNVGQILSYKLWKHI